MTPTKIILEVVPSLARHKKHAPTSACLRVLAPDTANGQVVLERVPLITGKSLPGFRKWGASYAKRFAIPFEDRTLNKGE